MMRRDPDLLRRILLDIEEKAGQTPNSLHWVEFDGVDEHVVHSHLKLLSESGLVDALVDSSCDGEFYPVFGLTSAGHDFIDQSSVPEFWSEAKRRAFRAGRFLGVEAIKASLAALATSAATLVSRP